MLDLFFGENMELENQQGNKPFRLVKRTYVSINNTEQSLKCSHYDDPFLIYSLAHIKHHAYNDGRIILDFNKFKLWFTHYKELAVSEWNSSRFDHLGQSVEFLQAFISCNEGRFENLKTHKKYIWSEKESTAEGSSLEEIALQGNK